MNSTSRGCRLVSSAARSPGRSSTGPEVWRRFTPSSLAMMLRERGLAEARRPEDQRVIQRLAALDRGLHEDLQLRLDLLLADIVGEPLRADGAIDGLFFLRARGLHDAIGGHSLDAHCGRTAPCSARRISSSVTAAGSGEGLEHRVTSAGL